MPVSLGRKIRRLEKQTSAGIFMSDEPLPVTLATLRQAARLRRKKAIAARLKPKSDYRRSRNRRKSTEVVGKKK